MDTTTFIAQDAGKLVDVKEGVQATDTSRTRKAWYRRRHVHCRQVTSVMVEFGVDVGGGLMRALSSVDLSESL